MIEIMRLKEDLPAFKRDMREAFQRGTVEALGETDADILPERDIDDSLRREGAVAYKALSGGVMVGGAIVVIDAKTNRNSLELLYVRCGWQGKGVGAALWAGLESMYPATEVWETVTPYFEKRNIHFYINRCGFYAVEFFNPMHPDPHAPSEGPGKDYFFRFEKDMRTQGIKRK